MGMTFHAIENLGPPFAMVAELGMVIPESGEASVLNHERKLLFFLQADCTGEIENFGRFAVRTGDILVVPRTCLQRYRVAHAGESHRIHALKITFALPLLPPPGTAATSPIRGNPELDLGVFVRHHFREIYHLPGPQSASMQEILRGIRTELEEHPPGVRHRVRSLATDLVVHVSRIVHKPGALKSLPPGPGSLVNEVKEYLLRNHARPLTLAEVARHVRKSEEHVARVIRKVTGQSVFGYLRTVRLDHAKTLLVTSNKTLTEVARLSGFSSLALFSRNFTRYVGRTASAYREERSKVVQWRPP